MAPLVFYLPQAAQTGACTFGFFINVGLFIDDFSDLTTFLNSVCGVLFFNYS